MRKSGILSAFIYTVKMFWRIMIAAIVWDSCSSEAKIVLRFDSSIQTPLQPVYLSGNGTLEADSMTICFRLRPGFYRPLSMFKNGGQEFKIEQLEKGYGTLYLNNKSYTFDMSELNLRPRVWHHVCYSYQTYQQGSLLKGRIKVTVNGVTCMNQTIIAQTLKLSKMLEIGHAFHGMVTDFYVWNQALGIEEVLAFTRDCKEVVSKNESGSFKLNF